MVARNCQLQNDSLVVPYCKLMPRTISDQQGRKGTMMVESGLGQFLDNSAQNQVG